MSLSLEEIAERLGVELIGSGSMHIRQVAPLARALPDEIGFVAHAKYRQQLGDSKAGAVIVPPSLRDATDKPRLLAKDPYLCFARLAQILNPDAQPVAGIHETAVVLSRLPETVSVGPLAFIAEGCEIGSGVIVGPGCVVEEGVSIGEGSLLRANVTVCKGTLIGARCILNPGCVVGSDGFGFARRADGVWEKIPQIGRAVIGDNVEIGANTTIDRGALDDTIIESGVKLDNLIQVAHNCRIGENSAMAALAGMAGSSSLGKRVMVGGQAGIMGHISVADDVVVSARSFASKTVRERGILTSAIPAQPHSEWMRNAVHLKHLDEMAERIRILEKKMKDLGEKA